VSPQIEIQRRQAKVGWGGGGGRNSKIKYWRTYSDMSFFPYFGVGKINPEFCPSILDTPCIYLHVHIK
jgi:hypothetical protein